ncbi:MAG: hypothetical protein IH984_11520 [Planctomycetes bacterium]|nr:hypothetical protein [Planctomycetota bacterium]
MIGQRMRGQASRNSKRSYISSITSIVAMLVVGQVASAQYISDFEAPLYTATANGDIITGQDGFYIPVVDSQHGLVYTYVGNALSLPQNPRGGLQFAGVTGGDTALPVPFARAQRDIPYGDDGGGGGSNCCEGHGGLGCDDQACQDAVCGADAFCCETEWDDICAGLAIDLCGKLCAGAGGGIWTVTFDIAATFIGQLPSSQNIGSFSTQVFPTAATFIALARWTDPVTAANWNADYVWYDSAGTQLLEQVNDPGFQNLQTEHWYRWSTTFDLDTNQITEVALTDITTNTTVTNNPVGRYLVGGSGGAPEPTGFRLFGGTNAVGAAGNTLAFDNINIATPVDCPWDLDGSGAVGTNDLLLLFAFWGQVGVPADFDGGGVGTSDLLILFANWGLCP